MPADVTSERLLREMSWEWQDVESLMTILIPTVPPGKALRKYQTTAANNKGTGTRPPLTQTEQITSGARQIVNDRIGSQVDSGRIELERDSEGRRRVRFRERREVADSRGCCPTCNRPFPRATVEKRTSSPLPSQLLPKVLYPAIPAWDLEWLRKMGAS